MMKADQSVRPSKRVIVVDDEESAKEQPFQKSVKREEEVVPSVQVVQLQQEVFKLNDMLQRTYRAARTAELRAEVAEKKLDSKIGIEEAFQTEKTRADDLEKELAKVSAHFEVLARQADNLRHENTELSWKNKSLKSALDERSRSTGTAHGNAVNNEQQERIVHLEQKLASKEDRIEDEKRAAKEDRARYLGKFYELTERIGLLKKKLDDGDEREKYRARIDELEQKLARKEDRMEEIRRVAKEDRTRYRTRIDELTHNLDQHERASKLNPDVQAMQQMPLTVMAGVAARPMQLPATAATAACPESSESSKEIKEEGEIDD